MAHHGRYPRTRTLSLAAQRHYAMGEWVAVELQIERAAAALLDAERALDAARRGDFHYASLHGECLTLGKVSIDQTPEAKALNAWVRDPANYEPGPPPPGYIPWFTVGGTLVWWDHEPTVVWRALPTIGPQ